MKPTDGLLVAAAALGILLALAGLVDAGNAPLDDTTVARVNGVPIPADELQSLLERRAREGVSVDRLPGTLDQLIDEELLIQRASELGILRRDSNVRVAIIQAMEKSILNEERGRSIQEEDIQAFYRDHTQLFAEPRRLQLEAILVRDGAQVPSLLAALMKGTEATALAAARDAVSLTRLPPVPLSLDALARRFPDDVLARLKDAAEGEVVTHESDRGIHLVKLVRIREAKVPAYEDIRLSVLNELQMQRQAVAYDEYLAWLRQRADIRKNERLAR